MQPREDRGARSWLAAGIGLALVVAVTAAARDATATGRRERDAAECVSGAIGKPMSPIAQNKVLKAIEAMGGDRLDEAVRILDTIPKYGLHAFGLGLTLQLRAGIAASRDELASAVDLMKRSVESGGFCGERLESARMQLAQLMMAREHWDEAIGLLEQVVEESPEPNGEAYYRIGLAQYRANRLDAALTAADKAIELGGAAAKETWRQLLLQIHWDRGEFAACVPILQRLVVENPTRDYWLRLGFVLYELERTDEALVALQLGDLSGRLDDRDDQLRLVQMEFSENLPFRAAERLERAIADGAVAGDQKTLEILSNAWLAARDRVRAIEPLERAAEMSADGRDWLRIAQISAQLDDWKQVSKAAQRAIEKGSLEDPGTAYLLVGMAHYDLKETAAARTAFTRAKAFDKTRGFATTWLAALDEARGATQSGALTAGAAEPSSSSTN